jgi:hypothetical protein
LVDGQEEGCSDPRSEEPRGQRGEVSKRPSRWHCEAADPCNPVEERRLEHGGDDHADDRAYCPAYGGADDRQYRRSDSARRG